ncbi:MAG TPA: high-affinity branched-chain amino acid ABC transporter ATP-binding protein LivG [Anaerolineaceae bacterium]|nr:MAG: high-affinity branched-chain amino acid ABC transporter ATP-binding protein LivG [Chloroflexi bacterium GWB2_54_36]HAL16143.1 high-affinity branched-chain amino acid ABC transporter ATP-binding protein LivG [Anaerolineaceae bacterium]
MSLLNISNLTMQFGGLVAVSDFNLELKQGKIAGLIGPNGSGKTTVFNVITGFYKPTQGNLFLDGKEITNLTPDRITAMGLTRIFQNSRVFRDLSVFDNVMIGHHIRMRSSPVAAVLRTPGYSAHEKRAIDQTMLLLEQLDLAVHVNEKAGALPYGLQRKLEVARALSTEPKVLLLDEPATGLSSEEKDEMIDFILKVRQDYGLTILLIEHHMRVVMGICEEISVLNYGKTIATGNPVEIQSNQAVIDAYLGEG